LVDALSLQAGDELEIVDATRERLAVAKDERRRQALERLASMRVTLPPDYKFDRYKKRTSARRRARDSATGGSHARREMGK
jgi:antitoxin component of MazEF toxin-antitoxin module